jgi:hypothetical protein
MTRNFLSMRKICEVPRLASLRLGLPTSTQLKDGLISLSGFPLHSPSPPYTRVQFGLTQRPQADPRLPQGYSFTTRSPWIYGNSRPARLTSSPISALSVPSVLPLLRVICSETVGRVIDHLYYNTVQISPQSFVETRHGASLQINFL